MTQNVDRTLTSALKRHWKAWAPGWLLLFVYFGSGLLKPLGLPAIEADVLLWILVVPLFVAHVWGSLPYLRGEVTRSQQLFWTMLAPLLGVLFVFGVRAVLELARA